MGARGDRHLYRLGRSLAYGLLTVAGVLGLAALVWAAMPQGAPVTYTASDVVTMPTGTTFTAQILNALGAFTTSSSLTAGGSIAYTGDITPTQITTNQDNYNPTGLATAAVLRLSSNASWSITGLQGGADGRVLLIENVGTQNITLSAGPTASTDSNEFAFPADVTMPPKALVLVKYDATDSKWRTISPTLTGAAVRATTLTLAQQSGDPSPPAADDWLIYTKATGLFIRDDLGNITGPLGTGGGGGGGGIGMTAALVIPSNITLSGEQTFETVTTSASRVFVVGQTTPTQNGFYITSASAWTRASDALAGAAFTAGTLVTITNGLSTSAGNRGSTWMFLTSGSYGSSNLTAVKTGLGPAGELAANKGAASGYASLGSDSKLTWTQHGSRATHGDVAPTGQITPTATTMGVQGSGGNVTMSSGTPRITGCTSVADHGKKLTLRGISTNLLTMPNGQGVRLCGNPATGSITFGLNRAAADFTCDGNLAEWQQDNCLSMQQVADVGRSVIANESTPFIIATDTGGTNRLEAYIDSGTNKASLRAIAGGSPATATELTNPQIISTSPPTCSATYPGLLKYTAGTPSLLQACVQDSGGLYGFTSIIGAGGGASTKAIFFPGAALEPDGANCHAHETATLNGGPKMQLFKCDDLNTSVFYGNVSMLNSGWQATAISLTIHVFHTSTTAGTFAGAFAAQCHAANETVDNTWSSAAAANVTLTTTASQIPRATATGITPTGTCAVDDNLFFRYTIDQTNFSTAAASDYVWGVTLTYTAN